MEKRKQRTGSREHFRELHKSTYEALFYYLYSRTADKQLAEDILQEAYILLWEKREELKDLAAVKTFMYITVRNKLMTHNRDSSTHNRLLENAPGIFASSLDDSELIVEAEVVAQVRAAVAKLPSQTRRITLLSLQGYTVDEIAERLSISPNTVKTLKKSAYAQLRTDLAHLRNSWLLFFLFLD